MRHELVARGIDHRARQLVEPIAARTLSPRRPFFASGLFYPTYWRGTAQALRASPPDVVHVHMFPQFVERVRRELPDATTVLHLHWGWLTLLDRAIVDRRLRAASLVLACSDALTAAVREAYPRHADRCHTIYNGVDVARFDAPAAAHGDRDDDPRLLFIGRIAPDKGVHVLLEAFERLLERHPTARLDIVGGPAILPREMALEINDDPLVKSLRPFYAERDVAGSYMAHLRSMLSPTAAGRVRFLGPVAHAEIPTHLRRADVVVNSAIEEAFGMPVAEAMAARRPVVASRVGGLPELVEDGVSGLLVRPNDAQALAAALGRLLDDPGLRTAMGAAGRRRAEDRFDWERIAVRAEQLYDGARRRVETPA